MNSFRKRLLSLVLIFSIMVGLLPVYNYSTSLALGTGNDVVAVAITQIGYKEKLTNAQLDDFDANVGKKNYTKYARDLGYNQDKGGYPWCVMFVWWCMIQGGVTEGLYPKSASTGQCIIWFTNRGWYFERGSYTPQPGDYIFLHNKTHTGLVEASDDQYVYTIEGNCSAQVKRMKYKLDSSSIVGYGSVRFDVDPTTVVPVVPDNTVSTDVEVITAADSPASDATIAANPGDPLPKPTALLEKGIKSEEVKWVQTCLNTCEGAKLTVDGSYGGSTQKAVKAFQTKYGLEVTGKVDPDGTLQKMTEVWIAFLEVQRATTEAVTEVSTDASTEVSSDSSEATTEAVVIPDNPGDPLPIPTSRLANGMKNSDEVKWVQTALNTLMNSGLKVDGNYGTGTVAAVKLFQAQYGLAADGICGPITRAKLLDEWRKFVVNGGVSNNVLKKGLTFTSEKYNCIFKVTSKKSAAVHTVEVKEILEKSVTSAKVPASVKLNGVTYLVTTIGPMAYYNCPKLKKVTIGKNVTFIKGGAFKHNKKLKSIVLPASLTRMNQNVFKNCKSLTTVTINSTSLTQVGKDVFKGISSKAVINVPKAKKSAYKKLLKASGYTGTIKTK